MRKKIVLAAFLVLAINVRANKSFRVPTLGGKIFWTDVKVINGWRIQENVFTGHCRLLDRNMFRYTYGNKEHCINSLKKFTRKREVKKTVVLIHGLGVRKQSLESLIRPLEKAGFHTEKFAYSAFFESLEDCAAKLDSVVEEYKDGELYFVTHSMGGILLRQYSKDYRVDIKSAVMLAPPNNGADIVDRLDSLGVAGILGVNGKRLTSNCDGLPLQLPGLSAPLMIIAGDSENNSIFRLQRDNGDGVISVSTTRLPCAQKHLTVKAYHLNIMKNKTVQQSIIQFFESTED